VKKVVTARRGLLDHTFVLACLVSPATRLGLWSPRCDLAKPRPDDQHLTLLTLRPVAYSLPVTTPDGQHSAVADEAALASRDRARSRWKVAGIFVAIAILGVLILSFELAARPHTQGACPSPGCPTAEPSQVWVAITALGAFAAGVGTLVSAIAAVLALRAATAARTAAAAPVKKSPAKRTRKRLASDVFDSNRHWFHAYKRAGWLPVLSYAPVAVGAFGRVIRAARSMNGAVWSGDGSIAALACAAAALAAVVAGPFQVGSGHDVAL
jgi:hypothetical protein